MSRKAHFFLAHFSQQVLLREQASALVHLCFDGLFKQVGKKSAKKDVGKMHKAIPKLS
jgi:hypothetical protein